MAARRSLVPTGLLSVTTTQRNTLTGAVGDTIWNSTTGQVETWNGSAWVGDQPLDADLTTIAGLNAASADKFIGSDGTVWAARNTVQVRTSLGLTIGSTVQAWDATLDGLAALDDPNADRILFWDESAGGGGTGAYAYLNTGSGLTISGTSLLANGVAADAIFDAKGDIAVATANDTASKLAVGAFGTVPKADTNETTGIVYGYAEDLRSRYLKPTGSYETMSRTSGLANQANLASGTVSLHAIALPKNFLVTNISFASLTTAAVTPTNWWFALADSSFLQLRATADQTTTAWAANSVKTVALSSTFTTTYEGLHYVCIMMAAATVISMTGGTTGYANLNSTTPRICFNGITGQTTPVSDGTNLGSGAANKATNAYAFVT